jgi:hypothetical protein
MTIGLLRLYGTPTFVVIYDPKSCCPLGVGLFKELGVAHVVIVALVQRD